MAKQAASRAGQAAPRAGSRKKSMPPPMADAPREPTHEEIAARAYGLYLARGAQEGDALQDWVRAEAELRALN